MNQINLLFTMNRNYVMPCVVALTSIFENDKDSKFNVFMLHSGIGDFEKQKIKELKEKYNHEINEIKVDEKYFENTDFKRWSKETWYRLLINEYIPRNLDRILYLDCDIIVTDSLKKFYEVDFENKHLATPIWEISKNEGIRLNLSQDSPYFPAGFLLYNLKKISPILEYKNIEKSITENKDRLKFADMDLLNIIFHGKVKPIYKDFYFIYHDLDWKEKKIPSIIHYSASKPWDNLIRGRYNDVWLRYLRLSPYSYLYEERFYNIKTKILRSRLCIYLVRTFLDQRFFNLVDNFLPKKLHNHIRRLYRKYLK